MATKVKLMTFLQQVRGYAEITNRRPMPRPPVLYLMELREQAERTHLPRRRLEVKMFQSGSDLPLPVKITHLTPGECALPVVVE